MKRSLLVVLLAGVLFGQVPSQYQAALDGIRADSMRGNLSFLASDLLEGRATPSRGLDIAAEYIAAQFRRAGLKPAGDDGYFQTARWQVIQPKLDGFEMRFQGPGGSLTVPEEAVSLRCPDALDVKDAPVVYIDLRQENALAGLKPETLAEKVVVAQFPNFKYMAPSDGGAAAQRFLAYHRLLDQSAPLALIPLWRDLSERFTSRPNGVLLEVGQTPAIFVRPEQMRGYFRKVESGVSAITASLHVAAPEKKLVKLRNVIAVLPGSDPVLSKTYVLLTAHYDHIGMKASGKGDRIFNGADDDGSGTVSVIEIADALSRAKVRPKRSIVFMTFFGEELGMLGSRYYTQHPVFPLSKTVADVNLEQVGRTDSTDGAKIAEETATGFEYSTLPPVFVRAGKLTGVTVDNYSGPRDPFFSRSDNDSFARAGIPAHSFCVALEFPDYHGVGDEWPKIDYDNMAKVDRMTALGLLFLADDTKAPVWSADVPEAAPYRNAAKPQSGE